MLTFSPVMSPVEKPEPQITGKRKRGGRHVGPDGKVLNGRRKGSKNKATLEREFLAEQAKSKALLDELNKMRADDAAKLVAAARAANTKLPKDILNDFANVLAGAAAYYQPTPGNANANEKKFLAYTELALYAADKAAPYFSPRLAAVMIGQAQTRKIVIEGGLPSPDALPPPQTIEAQALPQPVTDEPAAPAVVPAK